jgi:invasion protein IalB
MLRRRILEMFISRMMAAVLAAMCLATVPALAQEAVLTNDSDASAVATNPQAPAEPVNAWGTRCVADARKGPYLCTTSQRLVSKADNQLIGSATIQLGSDAKPVLVVVVAVGMAVADGISLDVDGAALQKLPVQACDRSGCFATTPVSDAMLTSMQKGTALDVGFSSLSKQAVKLQMSLAGFSAAYQKML